MSPPPLDPHPIIYEIPYNHDHAASLSDEDRLEGLKKHINEIQSSWPPGNTLNRLEWSKIAPADVLQDLFDGFKLNPTAFSGQCKNHKSVTETAQKVEEEMCRLEEMGKVEWLGLEKPQNLVLTPLAGIVKPREGVNVDDSDIPWVLRFKMRLIKDYLRSGLNAALPPPPKLKFSSIADGVHRMRENYWTFVIDLADSFYNWAIHENSQNFLGFFSPHSGRYGRFKFAPMGLSWSPFLNDRGVKSILEALKRQEDIDLADFVDDNFGAASSKQEAWLKFEKTVLFLLKLGVRVSTKASGLVPPSQKTQWIGFIFDSINMVVSISEKKRVEAKRRIGNVIAENNSKTLRVKKLLEMQGYLEHLSEVFLQGRRRRMNVWGVINDTACHQMWQRGRQVDPLIELSPLAIEDLEWWSKALENPIERKVIHGEEYASLWTTRSPDFLELEKTVQQDNASASRVWVFETDAAKNSHWGFTDCQSQTYHSGQWPIDMVDKDINIKELWVGIHLCQLIGQKKFGDPSGRRILLRMDNTPSVSHVNYRRGDVDHELNKIAGELDDIEREGHFLVMASYIPGKLNVIADELSRKQDAVSRLSADAYLGPNASCLLPKLFRDAEIRFGSVFTIDAFSDNDGKNSRVQDSFVGPRSNALLTNFNEHKVWAFPPPILVRPWVDKVIQEKINGLSLVVLDSRFITRQTCKKIEFHFKRVMKWKKGARIFGRLDVNENTFKRGKPPNFDVILIKLKTQDS